MSYPGVKKTKYGFYQLAELPSEDELSKYYHQKYFQESKSTYQTKYSSEEIQYINNKIIQKEYVIKKLLNANQKSSQCMLDIGAGEGWALKFFSERGWEVAGIDFSEFGCKTHNPDMLSKMSVGDLFDIIEELINQKRKFTLIFLDNILEHVLQPKKLIERCKLLMSHNSILVIEVPNDFSLFQNYLLKNKFIKKPYWVISPDHISYFNKSSLNNFLSKMGLQEELTMSDYPIDINLLNKNSNYYENKDLGPSCNQERVHFDNFITETSVDKTVSLYKALADLNIGRQIVNFSKLQ